VTFLRKRKKLVLLSKELVKDRCVKYSVNIPKELHEEFRRKAFMEDKDMKDVVLLAIRKYVGA
jgi:hypothetical protein